MRTIPHAPETTKVENAPIELDDALTGRDAWMFTPLLAIMIALPIMVSALFAFSAWNLANRDEASLSGPPATFATRWPEQSLPVLR